jgi:hypothetical protein
VIGDDVNLTSRLEGINKYFGTTILVSEATMSRTGGEFATRHLGQIVVKGRAGAISVHELVATAADVTTADRAFIDAFERAWRLYAARDFTAALVAFEACLVTRADDHTTQLYRERCQELIAAPPGDNWSPAIEMTDK